MGGVQDSDGLGEVHRFDHRQHRPKNFLIVNAHPRYYTGKYGGLIEGALIEVAAGGRFTAQDKLSAFLLTDLDVFMDVFASAPVDHRPHLHRFVQAVAQSQLACGCLQHLNEPVVDLFMEDQAAGGGATLPSSSEGPPQYPFQGQFQVGVVHDDLGVLTTQLQRYPLQFAAGPGIDPLAHRRTTGETDGGNVRMVNQGLPHFTAAAMHEVNHPGWYPRLQQDFHKGGSGGRGIGGRLEHHRIAAGKGREQLPGGDRQGEVPGGDHPYHPQWHAGGHIVLVW